MLLPVLIALLLIGLLALAGARYERRAEQALAERYPPPGQLVDVGGRRLHLVCMGDKRPGQPTVIFEAGHGDWSASWRRVQPQIGQFARTCAYDRAGFGWSDPGPLPRSPVQMAAELHALLQRAGEAPPYLFVGHSLGASLSRMYASLYPGEVVGMVWIDSAHEDMQRYLPFWPAAYWGILAATRAGAALASVGLVRLLASGRAFAIYPGATTPTERAVVATHAVTPRFFTTMYHETVAWRHQPNWAARQPGFGALPVVMLEAQYSLAAPSRYYPRRQWRQYLTGWHAIQDDLARLSERTTRVTVSSGHLIQIEQPERVIWAVETALGLL